MTAWVALVYLCAPAATGCTLIGSPNVLYDEQACWSETTIVSQFYNEQGFTAIPYCHPVELGVPA